MTATYHSKICAIAHNAMQQLFTAGLLDAERMVEFDILCRTDVTPDMDLAAIRRTAAQQAAPSVPRNAMSTPSTSAPGPVATAAVK